MLIGLAAGLLAAFGAVSAAPAPMPGPAAVATSRAAPAYSVDPAKQRPGAISVSTIDFKRGDGGAGRMVLHFSSEGAAPDLRNQGASVVIEVGNAQLPASLQKPINVSDFATPVQQIDANAAGAGTRIILSTTGPFETRAYQSGRDYIVEVLPRAAASQGATAMGATSSSMGATVSGATTTRSYAGKPVTFNFQDVPVRTVLQLIAEESNLNIVASDTVQGNVTLRLINVPWDQALDIVLQAKSLDKRRSGNVVWVAPQKEIAQFEQDKEDARINLEQRAEKITEYIPVNYGSAEDIANLLTEGAKGSNQGGAGQNGGGAGNSQDRGFLSQRGSISFDKRTNTLLVIDIPERVANIRDLVSKLDKPVDQVVIEARIVIASENVARELGAKFGISGFTNNGKAYFSDSITNNIATQNSIVDANRQNSTTPPPSPLAVPKINRGLMSNLPATLAGASSLALSILNAGYALDVELSAIQTEGRAEVISNPRIVTSNQKEAVIRQGKEIGYLTVSGGQGGNVPTVQFKEALLELKVTPTITDDGRVFLNLAVKKDELDGFISLGASFGSVPQIAKREVTTAVLMEDGQTVVIGGVYEFSDRSDLSKVPFLGDLPVIGNLFRNKNRTKSKAELLIFVTPKVMRVAQRN